MDHAGAGYGLKQEFITPYTPQQKGLVERVIRALKEQRIHRHRFETLQHASSVIGDWIQFYNHRWPHQALDMKTPAEVFALAAWPVQDLLGQYSESLTQVQPPPRNPGRFSTTSGPCS